MLKVMIVDDMPVFLDYLKQTIDWPSYGFELVCEANNGADALNLAIKHKPDIVLSDINMPYMNGLDFTEALKEQLPLTSVVLITGHSEFEYARKAVRLGVSDYIVKPFEKEELIVTLLSLQQYHEHGAKGVPKKDDVYIKREHYFRSLIYGKHVKESDDALLPVVSQWVHKSKKFRVVAIAIESGLGSDVDFDREMSWKQSVGTIIEDLIDEGDRRFSFTDYDGRMLVMACLNETPDEEVDIDDFKRVVDIIETRLNLNVSIGIGGIHSGLDGIVTSYEESVSALNHKSKVGRGHGVNYINDEYVSRSKKIADDVKGYILREYQDPFFNMSDMSKELLVNQTYLRSMFKSETGMTISDYVLKLRMEKAKEMIALKDSKLSTIAQRVGYVDAGYFSKCFKRFYGKSPSDFRN
ncbi:MULTISPECIES: response regulator [unclassified Fusibacter]|uniref:response regulator n=1 Tax=unclassified Fusibacter TaxID=2624464 RepID=UPI00101066C9|nr:MULTISPECIES: response regulator [unclassified Fusibacter]MCK8060082.1 response regulator [Fusibacter sp. A2]NPE22224.1 response regulator [Fusibacter sp. A1]RXV60998.1 response regulator [Fusibacter sp. A1]